MHQSVMAWVSEQLPSLVTGLRPRVLEVGSANVNGSVRLLIEKTLQPISYVGLDIAAAPGVDVVCPVENYPGTDQYDLVVSCEMLEHAADWVSAFRAMARLLKPGGTLLLTCRGPGFPRHNPPDHWRFTPHSLALAAMACGLSVDCSAPDPQVPGAFLRAVKMAMPIVMREPGDVP
jgi:SAM-dependent methyltransferase